ncbi:hypothetical protein PTSG_13133 [Salpingoeca rosetta]|uniref:Uncharacterized protein n=1 Tax=Salpingoeca rosetta (strain ATCC 50818 / BSB-021) TaxID=946362 RepID=F2USI0_SALR5|nr:hypothetical protein PTSG_13133 [Salpingoeca rosetta]|eukprot:XP_004987958.1 hypothetical protein PTSG_13133 [Salpingoeca rosetta]
MLVQASAFPEHRLLELPRILRSIPDKVVEMMQRRVVFMFEEFFKSLSTQVHTALESARINLFSGDNAWQRTLEPAAVTPPSTNHRCSGGMNRRALPCDDHPQQQPTHPPPPMQQQQQRMHHHHHLQLNTFPNQPINQPTNPSPAAAGGSWLFAAGNRWRQHKLHFRLEAEAAEVRARRRGERERTCVLDGWMDEEQLWTHTSMVMVGTSNHSDAVISAATVITIAIDRTAAITLRPTPAPVWREADIAHVSRSDEEAPPRHVPVQDLSHQLRHAAGVQQRGRAGSASTTPGPKHAGQDIDVPDPRQPSSRPHETRQPRADTIVLENATTTTNVRNLTTFTCRDINATLFWLLGDPSTLYAYTADALPTCGGYATARAVPAVCWFCCWPARAAVPTSPKTTIDHVGGSFLVRNIHAEKRGRQRCLSLWLKSSALLSVHTTLVCDHGVRERTRRLRLTLLFCG